MPMDKRSFGQDPFLIAGTTIDQIADLPGGMAADEM